MKLALQDLGFTSAPEQRPSNGFSFLEALEEGMAVVAEGNRLQAAFEACNTLKALARNVNEFGITPSFETLFATELSLVRINLADPKDKVVSGLRTATEGILGDIGAAIKNFFQKIIDFFKNLFSSDKDIVAQVQATDATAATAATEAKEADAKLPGAAKEVDKAATEAAVKEETPVVETKAAIEAIDYTEAEINEYLGIIEEYDKEVAAAKPDTTKPEAEGAHVTLQLSEALTKKINERFAKNEAQQKKGLILKKPATQVVAEELLSEKASAPIFTKAEAFAAIAERSTKAIERMKHASEAAKHKPSPLMTKIVTALAKAQHTLRSDVLTWNQCRSKVVRLKHIAAGKAKQVAFQAGATIKGLLEALADAMPTADKARLERAKAQ